jgi:preprotein translocase subunit SecA
MVSDLVAAFAIEKVPARDWDWQGLGEAVYKTFGYHIDLPAEVMDRLTPVNLDDLLRGGGRQRFAEKLAEFGEELMDHLIKVIMLQVIDTQWKDHLLSVDHLKEGIGLRGYGQKDPKQEYKREAYQLFMDMMTRTREEVVEKIFWVQVAQEEEVARLEAQVQKPRMLFNLGEHEPELLPIKGKKRVGRNDPCTCGSGQKYKKCCGK